jgi:DNA-binding NarL/FixJ family response regulator
MDILVVDDHVLIRDALRAVLQTLKDDVIVFEATNRSQAIDLIGQHPNLDLVLLDLGLPDCDGFSMLADLRQSFPAIPVVVMSALDDHDSVTRALHLGALGFIPKSSHRAVMLSALQLIFSGGIYVPPEILARGVPAASKPDEPVPPNASPSDLGLTERQMAVLALMAKGKSNKAIGRMLDLAEPTVKAHVSAVLKALKAANRTEAVVTAGRLGWKLPSDVKS